MKHLLVIVAAMAACGSPAGGAGGAVDGGGGGGDAAPADGGGGGQDGAGSSTDAGGAPSALSIIVEPNGNHGAELVDAITGAHQSVYMTMYELDNADVIAALIARKAAGVDVEIILDGSTTTKSFNTAAYNKLHTAHAAIAWSSSTFTLTHEKTAIIDGSVAWIMTMNATTSSPNDNREYLAIDTNAADITEATAVFKADHAMQAVTPSGPLVVADTNARTKLVALINSAHQTLDVEGEEFSDTDQNGVVDAVAAAARRGVTVHVIIGNSSPNATAIADVKSAGAHVVVTGPTSSSGTPTNPYIHAKAVVVDCVAGTCAQAFIGSENFSAASLGHNRELGVIFDSATEIAKVKTAIDTDFSHGVAQ